MPPKVRRSSRSPAPKARSASPAREALPKARSISRARDATASIAADLEALDQDQPPSARDPTPTSSRAVAKVKAKAKPKSGPSALQRWSILKHDEPGTWTPPPFEAQVEAIGLCQDEDGSFTLVCSNQYPAKFRGKSMVSEMEKLLRPDPQLFQSIEEVVTGMWLFSSKETPQSFEEYVRERPNLATRTQCNIYILPFSNPGTDQTKVGTFPDLEVLRSFVEAWFSLPCKLLPPEAVHQRKRVRHKSNGHAKDRQYSAQDILSEMKSLVPRDAYCLIGITMEDIWSGELNFVFGLASLRDRVGVFSFCRQDPAWYRPSCRLVDSKIVTEYPTERQPGDAEILLRRAHGTLSHEIGHQFGMRHCQFFNCRMRGSNGLKESDVWGDDMCPVCLHKLSWNLACGSQRGAPSSLAAWCMERYNNLLQHYSALPPLDNEAKWIEMRLALLQNEDTRSGGAEKPREDNTEKQAEKTEAEMAEEREAEGDAAIRAAFHRHDANGDGKISVSEFSSLLEALNCELPQEKLAEVFEKADMNKDGMLDLQEVLDWLLLPAETSASERAIQSRLVAEVKLVRSCSCDSRHSEQQPDPAD
eukprot:TRINITY_DN83708_c0_g1_i1.p1 TRINITY_DN83708_c0_g1~~TRINITY_DN83708_c0_g1_i1.p1  ORF type:complete len:588 (+),score=84.37 TRINITY_DN83708_c0_g1_i1:22-1785(+)